MNQSDEDCRYYFVMAGKYEDKLLCFPVVLNTKDYKEALQIVRCFTSKDPTRLLNYGPVPK